MTYAIATPIYGIPVGHNDWHSVNMSEELELMFAQEAPGIIMMYSGGGETPRAFGVEAGKEINECCHHMEISALVTEVKPAVKKKFDELWEALDDSIKKELLTYGNPRLFYLWSTS